MIDARIDSGIDTAMMTVLRQLPRSTRISSAVRHAAITASRTTPSIDARTNSDWSASWSTFRSWVQAGQDPRQRRLDAVDDVEGRGAARLHDRHQRRPLAVHADDVGLRRVAVAHVRHVADVDRRARPTIRIGRSFSSSTVRGLPLMSTSCSNDADLRRAGGQDQVLCADRVHHVDRRQALAPAAPTGSRST